MKDGHLIQFVFFVNKHNNKSYKLADPFKTKWTRLHTEKQQNKRWLFDTCICKQTNVFVNKQQQQNPLI